jgi:hypothetical protein
MTAKTTSEILQSLAPEFVGLDEAERKATKGKWKFRVFERSLWDSGDYDYPAQIISESEDVKGPVIEFDEQYFSDKTDYEGNGEFCAEARNQTRPLLDKYAQALVRLEKAEKDKLNTYHEAVLHTVETLGQHFGQIFENAKQGLIKSEHIKDLEFWEDLFQEPLSAVKEAVLAQRRDICDIAAPKISHSSEEYHILKSQHKLEREVIDAAIRMYVASNSYDMHEEEDAMEQVYVTVQALQAHTERNML